MRVVAYDRSCFAVRKRVSLVAMSRAARGGDTGFAYREENVFLFYHFCIYILHVNRIRSEKASARNVRKYYDILKSEAK